MWRFWLGLPLDICRLTLSLLWKALAGLWWLVMPSGISSYNFPTAHFLARTVAFFGIGAVCIIGLIGSDCPETTILVMFAWLLAAALLAIVNLAVASVAREYDR